MTSSNFHTLHALQLNWNLINTATNYISWWNHSPDTRVKTQPSRAQPSISDKWTFPFFFSYDTRGAHAETPSHWRDPEVLEERALFKTVREPAELIINPVLVCANVSCLKLYLYSILFPFFRTHALDNHSCILISVASRREYLPRLWHCGSFIYRVPFCVIFVTGKRCWQLQM